MTNNLTFELKITKIDQICRFELLWQQGQKIEPIDVTYPQDLINFYQKWQTAYLKYYQNFSKQNYLRGRVIKQGNLSPINPYLQLTQSETALLNKFKNWLNSEQISTISRTITKEINKNKDDSIAQINIFLTCSCTELERLPWEVWDLNGISNLIKIRITRTPSKINANPATPKNHHSRTRILAIFGDTTGINLKNDHKILASLSTLAELKIINWHENKPIDKWREEICQEIADSKGWDMLFFAGHSDENTMTGGVLGIAPNQTMTINQLTPYLQTAQKNGLQFAFFNSCSGLNIAQSLIDLGLNQVVIMREPIHNTIAQEFLKEFLTGLAQDKNVSEALYETYQTLKTNLNYPSSYLIPSLFGHPYAPFYQLKPFGWKVKLKEWLPTSKQAIALSSIVLLSLLSPVQEFLLDKRLVIQAIYRDLTTQIPKNIPPVILISIDEESLNKEKIIKERNPLNRQYLAKIIDKLSKFNTPVIGIDYLLDRPQVENDQILAESLQNAIAKNNTKFIFSAILEGEKEIGISPNIATLNSVMQSSTMASTKYLEIPNNCLEIYPFSYLIAVNQVLFEKGINIDISTNQKNLKTQILNDFYQDKTNDKILNFLQQVKKSPVTEISEYFRQRWLQPINDFSLPLESIYYKIPAWELLEKNQQYLLKENQVILIAAGGYAEAGIDNENKDYFPTPLATRFWQIKNSKSGKFTGGEINAYMIHHWLKQHLVTPIPDLWLILIMALLGRISEQWLMSLPSNEKQNFTLKILGTNNNIKLNIFYLFFSLNLVYLILTLQVYITLKLVFPFFLPSLSFWLYFLPLFRRYSYEK